MRRATSLRRLVTALLLVGLTACGGQPAGRPDSVAGLAVGATPDTQSVVLANLYAAALRYFGTPAHVEDVADPLAKLDTGQLDVVPGFTGRLLGTFEPGAPAPGSGGQGTAAAASRGDEQVYKAMVGALPEGITAGDYATAAEDKPTVAVTAATAKAWGGRDLTGLVEHCPRVRIGRLQNAPAGSTPGAVGSCRLPAAHEFADSTALFAALRDGRIDAAWTSTADPAVPVGPGAPVLLVDEKPMLIPAENVVPLYRRNELDPQQVLALNQIAGVLDTAALQQMDRKVAGGADPRAVVDEWLADNPLGR